MPRVTKETFVISDLHFGHKNVTEFEPSREDARVAGGFATQEEMLIHRWNNAVGVDDEVLVLGDYTFRNIQEYTSRLNGNLKLIRGNHDRSGSHAYESAGFTYTYDTVVEVDSAGLIWNMDSTDSYLSALIMQMGGKVIMFSHYPVDFFEDFYTRQREVDLTMRVKTLSDIARRAGVTINIHGHTHSQIVDDTESMKYLNVSCENLDFTPIRLGHLLEASGL